MVGMDHGPARPAEVEDERGAARNARVGLVLFFIYLALYASFVAVSVFWPGAMEIRPWRGVNLAILWGFGLIAAAMVLALGYSWICRKAPGRPPGKETS